MSGALGGRGLWRIAFALSVVVNLAVLYAPRPPGAPGVPGLDKMLHAFVFAVVAWTGLRAGLAARLLVPVLVLHAVVSEVVQHTLLGARTGEPADVAADLAGTFAAWGLVRLRGRETIDL